MGRSSVLQIIALVAMTIDHVGAIFFPHMIGMRIIGRLALPVFVYGVASGYLITRDKKKYLSRLLILAIVSVIPHLLLWPHGGGNIVISFFMSIMIMMSLDQKKWVYVVGLVLLSGFQGVEYGAYSIALILTYRYFNKDVLESFLMCTVLTIIHVFITRDILQIFAIVGFYAVSYLPELKERLPFPRKAFYVYYPLHMMIIACVGLYLHKLAF